MMTVMMQLTFLFWFSNVRKMAWNKNFGGLRDDEISLILENMFGLEKIQSEECYVSSDKSNVIFETGLFVISTSLSGNGVRLTQRVTVSEKFKRLVSKAKNIIVPLSFEYHDDYRGLGSMKKICSHFALLFINEGKCTFIDTLVKKDYNIKKYKRWCNVKSKILPILRKDFKIQIKHVGFHRFRKSN